MIDRLAAVLATVRNDAIAGLKIQQLCNFVDLDQQVAGNHVVIFGQRVNVLDLLLGNQKNVYGSLRLHVVECDAQVIFVDDVGRNFFVNDFLEDRHGVLSGVRGLAYERLFDERSAEVCGFKFGLC